MVHDDYIEFATNIFFVDTVFSSDQSTINQPDLVRIKDMKSIEVALKEVFRENECLL